VISILKAPLWRGFFSLWLLAAGVCAAKGVDTTHKAKLADVEPAVVDPRYVVRIESITREIGERQAPELDTIDITINGFGKGIGGFDIKIGVDGSDLQILEILPGELIDSCHWELFSPRKTTNLPTTQLPLEVWQIIGLSQTIPDSMGPVCFGFERPAALMRLVVNFSTTVFGYTIGSIEMRSYESIFFYWEDCTDNTISTESGDTLCVSSRVFDLSTQEISDKRPLFPSRTGIPRQCINPSRANHPHKLVDFYNGGFVLLVPHAPKLIPDSANLKPTDSSQEFRDTGNSPK
jgi:hypothetical protein